VGGGTLRCGASASAEQCAALANVVLSLRAGLDIEEPEVTAFMASLDDLALRTGGCAGDERCVSWPRLHTVCDASDIACLQSAVSPPPAVYMFDPAQREMIAEVLRRPRAHRDDAR